MHPLVQLAKSAVENYIETGEIISVPAGFSKEYLTEKAGAFVTIKKERELRGCIGTYLPTEENIAKEVIRNAIVAATEDYRFGPIRKEELSFLSYVVYILNAPELVNDVKDLDPKKYGVIVKAKSTSFKSGLLLPDLEGINTSEEQIAIACQKGGINPDEEKILIYRFSVEKYQ